MFILLSRIFHYPFNLFINNIVRESIIDESLFYVFFIFYEILFWRRLVLHRILDY